MAKNKKGYKSMWVFAIIMVAILSATLFFQSQISSTLKNMQTSVLKSSWTMSNPFPPALPVDDVTDVTKEDWAMSNPFPPAMPVDLLDLYKKNFESFSVIMFVPK